MLALRKVMVVLEQGVEQQSAWQMAKAWAAVANAQLHAFMPLLAEHEAHGDGDITAEVEAESWLAQWLGSESQGFTKEVSSGEKWCDQVLAETQVQQPQLLVVGGHVERKQLQKLMRHLPCPLYIAKQDNVPRCVAGAIGVAREDTKHQRLNTAVLEYLKTMGSVWGAKTCVLSALPNTAEVMPLMGEVFTVGYVPSELEDAYRQRLREQVIPFGVLPTCVYAEMGRVEDILPDMVNDHHVDCLIVGTVARQALGAFWFGNTAETVLPKLKCDVLVLRPEDYYEPEGPQFRSAT